MTDEITFSRGGVRAGFRACVPIALGVGFIGLVFGVLARQSGLGAVEAGLMSALVFAGAAQFVAIELWQQPLPVVTIVVATLVVNLRHLLMGATLVRWFSSLGPVETYGSVFFMIDENWALTMGEFADGSRDAAFLLGSGVAIYLAWVAATVLGALAGGIVTDVEQYGLDFALVAVFITLLVGLWDGRSDLLPWASAAVVATVSSLVVPGSAYILLGGLAGVVVAVVSHDGD